ncbi:hypothetical protein A3A66_04590 [Microgenomates group bacterium RIFCSPLOWO2_01_FULL_46_13]|nr:MAG: hypothetical protein A2783_05065 [Microgenomates group bacterium RIFCSPHIGHO2_01_FULL_45_11]OGV94246.1 MAG: hypothetical protein A3A66_04590 [Microgenomates group bacterium RIFCSPLOWO2_01_FULL_46_13]
MNQELEAIIAAARNEMEPTGDTPQWLTYLILVAYQGPHSRSPEGNGWFYWSMLIKNWPERAIRLSPNEADQILSHLRRT